MKLTFERFVLSLKDGINKKGVIMCVGPKVI